MEMYGNNFPYLANKKGILIWIPFLHINKLIKNFK